MEIRCRAADVAAFTEAGFTESEPSHQGSPATLYDCEANYAYEVGDGNPGNLPLGIPFYGHHEAGSEYPAAGFASDGVTVRYAPCQDGDTYGVRFDETGAPNQKDLDNIKSYIAFKQRVRALVDGETNPEEKR